MSFVVFLSFIPQAIILYFLVNVFGSSMQNLPEFPLNYESPSLDTSNDSPMGDNFLFVILIPNIYMFIISALFKYWGNEKFTNNIYMVIILYFVFRNIMTFLVLRRKELWNFKFELSVSIISISFGVMLYFLIISEKNNLLIGFDEFKNEIWLIIIIFLFSFIRSGLNAKITKNKITSKRMRENYIQNTYLRFQKKYNDIVIDKKPFSTLLYSIMIHENFNRSIVVRKLENLLSLFSNKRMTLGIMQVESDVILSDRQSIIQASKIIKEYYGTYDIDPSDEDTMFYEVSKILRFYNPDDKYVNDVLVIFKHLFDYTLE